MKVLLMPMGSYGDIHPYVGLGVRLKSRGHDVVVSGNRHFEPLFRSHELHFIALESSSDYTAFYRKSDHSHPTRALIASGRWCTLEPMREVFRIIAGHYVPGETVVVSPYYSFGARIAREKLGVPLATTVLLPYELRSIYRSPVLPRPLVLEDWVPRISKRCQFWIMDRFFVDRVLGHETNAFRAELGLPAVKRFLAGWCFSPDRVICFFPEWYASPQPDWPPQTVMTGFPRWDPPHVTVENCHEALEFAKGGSAPIIFTPGSYNQDARQFLRAAVESCVILNKRGILLTRYRDQLPEQLPPEVRHFDYAPLEALLPHAAALVSHGGIGTVAQALAAGVPQLVMPIAYNQPDDAVRLKRLGVADFIPPRKFKGPLVAHKLDTLLASHLVVEQCRKTAARFPGLDAIDHACDILEKLQGLDRKTGERQR